MAYKMIAINDDTSTCECCGKSNLKRVVTIENVETGEVVRYGVDCAAKAMKIKKAEATYQADVLDTIKRWQGKGFTIQQIVVGLGNRGYGAELRANGMLRLRGIGEIAL
jgi:hypothetical protein